MMPQTFTATAYQPVQQNVGMCGHGERERENENDTETGIDEAEWC